MNKIAYGVALGLGIIGLSGCASQTAQNYSPSVLQARKIAQTVPAGIKLTPFTMPQSENMNTLSCREFGAVTLPAKLTISSYIQNAFANVLQKANKQTHQQNNIISMLGMNLTAVDFSTISGTWTITGQAVVDKHAPVAINSTSDFAGNWYSWNACEEAAQSFPVAVNNFIQQTFANVQIKKELQEAKTMFIAKQAKKLAQQKEVTELAKKKTEAVSHTKSPKQSKTSVTSKPMPKTGTISPI